MLRSSTFPFQTAGQPGPRDVHFRLYSFPGMERGLTAAGFLNRVWDREAGPRVQKKPVQRLAKRGRREGRPGDRPPVSRPEDHQLHQRCCTEPRELKTLLRTRTQLYSESWSQVLGLILLLIKVWRIRPRPIHTQVLSTVRKIM